MQLIGCSLSNLSLCPRDPRHHLYDPHDAHNPHTRPLASSAAIVTGCAPTHCVIAALSLRKPGYLGDAVGPQTPRHLSRPPHSPLPPQSSSTCNCSRAYSSGRRRSMTLKTAGNKRRSGLWKRKDGFSIVSHSGPEVRPSPEEGSPTGRRG